MFKWQKQCRHFSSFSSKLSAIIKNSALLKKSAKSPQNAIYASLRALYPNGTQVKFDNSDISKMYSQTRQLSRYNDIIFGGMALTLSDLYASADVLYCDEFRKWNIAEVYDDEVSDFDIISDMAFKKFVFEQAGFAIYKCVALKMHERQTNAAILFDAVEVTKDVKQVYDEFSMLINQDSVSVGKGGRIPKSDNSAYIDYRRPEADKIDSDLLVYAAGMLQSYCRILINGRVHYFMQYLRHTSDNIYRAQVDFLIRGTKTADVVYVRNFRLEMAHHRQMAKIFPDKTAELTVLNQKLRKCVDDFSLPGFYEPKIAEELAEFMGVYKQRHNKHR